MILKCPKCFRNREEARSQPLPGVKVCGGCAIDLENAIGFAEYQGFQLTMLPVEGKDPHGTATGEEPPKPPAEPSKPTKP